MNEVSRKESKLLGRTELEVVFPDKSGALKRMDAIKEVAHAMKVDEKKVTLVELAPAAGSRGLHGKFHVYQSEDARKTIGQDYLAVRLLTKEEREALKQAKKKAEQAAAQAAPAKAKPKAK